MFYKELLNTGVLALTFEKALCYLCARPSRGKGRLTDTGMRQWLAARSSCQAKEAWENGYG